ncbi:MAG: SH3 domain-containing protein [Anaerolineae bacterium]|nr:SH3 domain-containing protein [Anaerolineae bacterium]
MRRNMIMLVLALCLLLSMVSPAAVAAQGAVNAWTVVILNMRAGPGFAFDVVAELPVDTSLVLLARDPATAWLLGQTADGSQRGWVAANYLLYREGFSAVSLPISGEIITVTPAAVTTAAEADTITTNTTAPAAGVSPALAAAAGLTEPDAWTVYTQHIRSGPGTNYGVITALPPNTPLYLQARDENTAWLLARTPAGFLGWIAAGWLYYQFGFEAANLPVNSAIPTTAPGFSTALQSAPTTAPSPPLGAPYAWTLFDQHMRSGPGTSYPAIGMLPIDTELVIDGRNSDTTWLFAHTSAGEIQGWIAAGYLWYQRGFSAVNLPVIYPY